MNTEKTEPALTIGRLASAADINVETIRYYQRTGLIKEPKKPASGFRIYSKESLTQLKFIKRAQRLGFTLKEISELLELGQGHCSDVKHKAEEKREIIVQQIKDLQALQDTLEQLIRSCKSGSSEQNCPIVETLSNN